MMQRQRLGSWGRRCLAWMLAGVLMVTQAPWPWAAADRDLEIDVQKMSGEVSLRRSGKAVAVMAEMPMYAGDVVVTGARGEIILAFENGSLVKLGPLSSLTLHDVRQTQQGQKTKLTLDSGSVFLDLEKLASPEDTFKVQTLNAVASVRGTVFEVMEEGGESEVNVLEGEVEVGEGAESERVGAGFQTRFKKGKRVFGKRKMDGKRLALLKAFRQGTLRERGLWKKRRAMKLKKMMEKKKQVEKLRRLKKRR